jgi:hypothetical protein
MEQITEGFQHLGVIVIPTTGAGIVRVPTQGLIVTVDSRYWILAQALDGSCSPFVKHKSRIILARLVISSLRPLSVLMPANRYSTWPLPRHNPRATPMRCVGLTSIITSQELDGEWRRLCTKAMPES